MDDSGLTKRYRRAADIRFRKVGDEGMVIRQRASEVLVLNDTGIRVLELLDGNTAEDALLTSLADEYQVDSRTLGQDIQHYLDELLEAGLIELVPTSEESP